MKVRYKGMEIDCTPDEFETLTKKGLLGNSGTADTKIGDEWNEETKKVFEKMWRECDHDTQRSNPAPYDGVALYGCEVPRNRRGLSPYDVVAAYGCYMPGSNEPQCSIADFGTTIQVTDSTAGLANTGTASDTATPEEPEDKK